MICRGKSKTDGEWVKGYLVKYQPTAGKDEWVVGIVPCYASALYIIEVIPETIGECSEQKNSKENKIFVGDIIEHHFIDEHSTGVVKFGEFKTSDPSENFKNIGFYVEWLFDTDYSDSKTNPLIQELGYWIKLEKGKKSEYNYVNFIGNIHDNPELLKVKEVKEGRDE